MIHREMAVEIRPGLTIPSAELSFTASRSGGPGGQHVNTTCSRVHLHWNVRETAMLNPSDKQRVLERLATRITDGMLTVTADTERSQHANRRIACQRLGFLIRLALQRSPVRIPTRISHRTRERRQQTRMRRSRIKRLRSRTALEE